MTNLIEFKFWPFNYLFGWCLYLNKTSSLAKRWELLSAETGKVVVELFDKDHFSTLLASANLNMLWHNRVGSCVAYIQLDRSLRK